MSFSVSATGIREPLNLTEILLVSVFDYQKSNVEHSVLSSGDAMVSKGTIRFTDDEVNVGTDVTVVQSTNNHATMSVRFQKTGESEGGLIDG